MHKYFIYLFSRSKYVVCILNEQAKHKNNCSMLQPVDRDTKKCKVAGSYVLYV